MTSNLYFPARATGIQVADVVMEGKPFCARCKEEFPLFEEAYPNQPKRWMMGTLRHLREAPKSLIRKESLTGWLDSETSPNGAYLCGNCLHPDVLVNSSPFPKKIKEIKIGDKILSSDGHYHEVAQVRSRKYSGELVKIITSHSAAFPLLVTPEHPIMIVARKNYSAFHDRRLRLKSRPRIRGAKNEYPIVFLENKYLQRQWCNAESVRIGDSIAYPISQQIARLDFIKLYDYSEKLLTNRRHTELDAVDKIPIDHSFFKLAGFYVAEGCCTGNQARFSFHQKETEYVNQVVDAVNQLFGIKATVQNDDKHNVTLVIVNSKVVSQLLSSLFGRRSTEKHLPFFIMELPPKTQDLIFEPYFNGDGTHFKNGSDSMTTASPILALQLKDILLRLGFLPSLYVEKREKSPNLNYRVDYFKSPARRTGWINGKYAYNPVRQISREAYEGLVYDIEVKESHDFCPLYHTVHNCFFDCTD